VALVPAALLTGSGGCEHDAVDFTPVLPDSILSWNCRCGGTGVCAASCARATRWRRARRGRRRTFRGWRWRALRWRKPWRFARVCAEIRDAFGWFTIGRSGASWHAGDQFRAWQSDHHFARRIAFEFRASRWASCGIFRENRRTSPGFAARDNRLSAGGRRGRICCAGWADSWRERRRVELFGARPRNLAKQAGRRECAPERLKLFP